MSQFDRADVDKAVERHLSRIILSKTQFKRGESAILQLQQLFSKELQSVPKDVNIYAQGSFATRTTIQPRTDINEATEFDVDVVIESADWQGANAALEAVEQTLRDNGFGARIKERKNTCVRLQYAEGASGEKFHVDVVPIRLHQTGRHVANRGEGGGKWTPSDPVMLVEWFDRLNDQYPTFRPAYLVFKRLVQVSDIKVASIVLQKLTIDAYTFKPGNHYLRELLEMFRAITQNLNDPHYQLTNPVNDSENLRNRVDAGVLSRIARVTHNAAKKIEQFSSNDDWELLIQAFGHRFPTRPTHIKELPLRSKGIYFDADYSSQNIIDADANRGNISGRVYTLVVTADHENSVQAQQHLDEIRFSLSEPVTEGAKVIWQVLNDPGEVPFQIRGVFEESNSNQNTDLHRRVEKVSWAGNHWIRAYIIDGNKCRHISKKFKVNVLRAA